MGGGVGSEDLGPESAGRDAAADQEEASCWAAPYYDAAGADMYHTNLACPKGSAIPEHRRRLDVAAMRARLPGW